MSPLKDKQKIKFYLWLIAGWTFIWFISNLAQHPTEFLLRIPNEIWRSLYLLVIHFIFLEYTWPFIKKKRMYLIFNILIGIFFFFIQMMLISYGLYAWRMLGISIGIYTDFRADPTLDKAISYQAEGGFFSWFVFSIAKHIYEYQKLKSATQRLRIEKQEAELNYLKSQTNPHFLFNTLNNIYSLSRDKSDLAPESILRLSKILRYMLYETSGDYVAIEQEMKIISDYIELEKLRYDETLRINFNHDVEDMKQALPPLILIPLVENAFKHGVSETRNRPFVDIHLWINRRQLNFIVKNSIESISDDGKVKENIGLSNLRRQLELLYTDYNLTIQHNTSVFTATLIINLASHVKNQMHHN